MTHPNPNRPLYLGQRAGDLTGKPYAGFWNPNLAPLVERVKEALAVGPVAAPLLARLEDAPRLLDPGYQELEDGLGLQRDGSWYVALRTEMPGVSPEMIDWWFGWHGEEPQRYKLWHPRAHLHAQWDAPDTPAQAAQKGRGRYVGRTSFVDEYLGSVLTQITIRFLPPAELGLDSGALADPQQATAVCARVGLMNHPVEGGYLVHHVRRVAGGSEMRSRFWIGGPYARVRTGLFTDGLVSKVARRVFGPTLESTRELFVHCAQEMAHLASFLPRLYAELSELR